MGERDTVGEDVVGLVDGNVVEGIPVGARVGRGVGGANTVSEVPPHF